MCREAPSVTVVVLGPKFKATIPTRELLGFPLGLDPAYGLGLRVCRCRRDLRHHHIESKSIASIGVLRFVVMLSFTLQLAPYPFSGRSINAGLVPERLRRILAALEIPTAELRTWAAAESRTAWRSLASGASRFTLPGGGRQTTTTTTPTRVPLPPAGPTITSPDRQDSLCRWMTSSGPWTPSSAHESHLAKMIAESRFGSKLPTRTKPWRRTCTASTRPVQVASDESVPESRLCTTTVMPAPAV